MTHLNIEFKAMRRDDEKVREVLERYNAINFGVDHQVDTYFKISSGKLKLREGNIENNLIHYFREEKAGPRSSNVTLYPVLNGSSLKEILTLALGIDVIVDKKREIYFIDNVKIHLDEVARLGNFLEVEAIDLNGEIGKGKLEEQCELFRCEFGVKDDDLLTCSYSDMMKRI